MVPSGAKLTVVGKITSVYGVKGWVKVLSYTDPLENLLGYKTLTLEQGANAHNLNVEGGKTHGKGLVLKLRGIDDRDAAQALCGHLVSVPTDSLPKLDDGEFYWHQLEGLSVKTLDQQFLGNVHHLLETGANDVLVVRPALGSIDQRERLLPYLPDQVIKQVDLVKREILVDWDSEF